MKQYFTALKARLSSVSTLRTVDAEWGQLNYEQPPVKFPCALIDMSSTDIAAVKPDSVRVHATVNVLVADLRYNRQPANAFDIYQTVEDVATKLQGWTDGRFRQLSLTAISPVSDAPGFSAYQLQFSTTFGLEPAAEPEPSAEPTTSEPTAEPTTTEPSAEPEPTPNT